MRFEGGLQHVSRQIENSLGQLDVPPSYHEALCSALLVEGRILSALPGGRWATLTLAACRVASGRAWQRAVPAAAAMEVFSAALELLDDLQDEDPNPIVTQHGPAEALNVSAGLLILAQDLLLQLAAEGVEPAIVIDVCRDLAVTAQTVAGGQHLDLRYEAVDTISEEQVIDVAGRKSGALIACTCRIGARVGGATSEQLRAIGEFGYHLGIAAQLENDLKDIAPDSTVKSDIRRGKKTLPLVSASDFGVRVDWSAGDGRSLENTRRALAASGALHYTWVIMHSQKQMARDALDVVAKTLDVQPLRALVE